MFGMMGMGAAVHQYQQASDARASAGRAQQRTRAAERHVQGMAERLDKLTLVCMAMWELLRERTDLTEEDLLECVKDIDLRDGVPDGKITTKIAKCPKCNRVMSPRHKKCLYCGAAKLKIGAFDDTL